jgi:hypothetical protein
MLSGVEREYIVDPKTFENRHKDSYVRKVRTGIRKKVGISIEEIARIIQFSETEFDKDNSNRGRSRKSVVPDGSINVLCNSLKWLDATSSERNKIEKLLDEGIQLTIRSIFEDTKIGKELYKK